jgi:uncharacterized RDD family membrane protein YckC
MKYKHRAEILIDGNLNLASLRRRACAISIDFVVVLFIFVVVELIIQAIGFNIKHVKIDGFTEVEIEFENASETSKYILEFLFICIPTIYFTLSTYFLKGQTVGKKIVNIKAVSLYHHNIGLWHCLERSLGYVASSLEFGLGFIQAFWNPNKMTLHDKIGETIVIKCPKKPKSSTTPTKAA